MMGSLSGYLDPLSGVSADIWARSTGGYADAADQKNRRRIEAEEESKRRLMGDQMAMENEQAGYLDFLKERDAQDYNAGAGYLSGKGGALAAGLPEPYIYPMDSAPASGIAGTIGGVTYGPDGKPSFGPPPEMKNSAKSILFDENLNNPNKRYENPAYNQAIADRGKPRADYTEDDYINFYKTTLGNLINNGMDANEAAAFAQQQLGVLRQMGSKAMGAMAGAAGAQTGQAKPAPAPAPVAGPATSQPAAAAPEQPGFFKRLMSMNGGWDGPGGLMRGTPVSTPAMGAILQRGKNKGLTSFINEQVDQLYAPATAQAGSPPPPSAPMPNAGMVEVKLGGKVVMMAPEDVAAFRGGSPEQKAAIRAKYGA